MSELVALEERLNHHARQGRRISVVGGRVVREDGNVTVHVPQAAAKGAALLVSKTRTPEFDDQLGPRCTKCSGPDVVLAIGFPGGDGEPIQLCRSCVDRQPGHPLVLQFRE